MTIAHKISLLCTFIINTKQLYAAHKIHHSFMPACLKPFHRKCLFIFLLLFEVPILLISKRKKIVDDLFQIMLSQNTRVCIDSRQITFLSCFCAWLNELNFRNYLDEQKNKNKSISERAYRDIIYHIIFPFLLLRHYKFNLLQLLMQQLLYVHKEKFC